MSLNNMGEREKPGGDNPVRGKKHTSGSPGARPLSPGRLFRAKGRDTLLAEELATLHEASKDRNGVLNIDPNREIEEKPRGRGCKVKRNMDSEIFGEAKPNPVPALRVRPDPGEQALTSLMPVDTRKDDAAKGMARADNMVQQMVTNQYPVAVNGGKETSTWQAKKRFDGDPSSARGGVEGFGNMGAKSHAMEENAHLKRPGLGTRAPEPFVAPEPVHSNKYKGKKIVAPGDQGIF